MPLTLPSGNLIANGKPNDATPLRADLEYILAILGALGSTYITGVKASKIEWDIKIPPSALPGFGVADGWPIASNMSSTPQQIQANGLTFVRRLPVSSMEIEESGWPAPAYGGWVVPSISLDNVYFFTHNVSDGGINRQVFSFDVGDEPISCVAARSGAIFVACTGSRKVKKIDTKTGAITDVLNLSTIHADYNDATAGCRKLYINRHGTYIYLVAKRKDTTSTKYRYVIQINVANQTAEELDIGEDYDIADLILMYSGATSSAEATVIIGQQTDVSGYGVYWRCQESNWSNGTPDALVLRYAAQFQIRAMVDLGTSFVSMGYNGTTTDMWWHDMQYDEHKNTLVSSRSLSYTPVGSGTDILVGSAVTDGRIVWCLDNKGYGLAVNLPTLTSDPTLYELRQDFNHATQGPVLPSGGCYTGSMFVFYGNKNSTYIGIGGVTCATR